MSCKDWCSQGCRVLWLPINECINFTVFDLYNCVNHFRNFYVGLTSIMNYYYYLLFSLALQPSAGYDLLVSRGFLITHNDAPQSVGLLWTSDQSVPNTSTWQHTTDKHPNPRWNSNPRSQQASGLRPRGHWNRRALWIVYNNQLLALFLLSLLN
jgi:hypothetical protein